MFATMPKTIAYIFFLLAVLLPIQNALVNLAVNRLGFPEWVSLWKEGLVAILMLFFLGQIWLRVHQKKYQFVWRNKGPLIAVTVATFLALVSSFWLNQIQLSEFLLGFRFELWWLWFFALAVTWWRTLGKYLDLNHFFGVLRAGVYAGFGLVALIALASLVWGQPYVSAIWNAQSATPSQFLIDAPECHALDYQVAGCRLAGPFSTPNHLSGYLLLVLPVFLIHIWRAVKQKKLGRTWLSVMDMGAAGLIGLFIFLSFSRYAWLGLFVFLGFLATFGVARWLPNKPWAKRLVRLNLGLLLMVPLLVATVAVNLSAETLRGLPLPDSLVKPSSTTWHARHTEASLKIIATNPDKLALGWGLPSAGPAAHQRYQSHYDNEMIMQNGRIAYQTGLLPPDLAIPENWFLQVVLNGGLVYLALYTLVLLIPIYKLILAIWKLELDQPWPARAMFFGLGFFAVILGNLLLHIWENQTIALYWTLAWLYSRSPSRK